MKALNQIIEQSKVAQHKRIVLPEGSDPRMIQAARRLKTDQVAEPFLIGERDRILDRAEELKVDLSGVEVVDPATSARRDELIQLLFQLRQHKGMTLEQAEEKGSDPLWFGNLLVKADHADGCVCGSVYTTADVVRSAIQVIGVREGCKMVSSCFIMAMGEPHHPTDGGLIFSDCALVVDPDATQLAEIAMSAARSAKSLLMEEPRVAMLSFSTSGSANHPAVQKVIDATRMVREQMPELAIDGDIQLDAALLPEISDRKVKDSNIHGRANVLIFPSLNAGNIGYKIAQRIGAAKAIGPMLQGLAKPANDLSRGCSVDDIYKTVAVTVMQANS